MASRRSSTEDALRALSALPPDLASPQATAGLRVALAHKSAHVVARAATLLREAEVAGLESELVTALEQRFAAGAGADKGCTAKTALLAALAAARAGRAEPWFERGVCYRQPEPSFGGSVDTAAQLRAACAHGLAALRHDAALTRCAELLADPEPVARVGAARALGLLPGAGAAALLRFKVLSGDTEIEVTAECLASLLDLDEDDAFAFVASRLEHGGSREQEAAALALGDAGDPRGREPLQALCERVPDAAVRRTGLLALGMLRCEEAYAYLQELVRTAPARTAEHALAALALGGRAQRAAAETAVAARGDGGAALAAGLARAFP